MPLIRIDHNSVDVNDELLDNLVKELLAFAMTLHGMNEDQISIFTQSYSKQSHSTAAAEIEIRAKRLEYGSDPNRQRQEQLDKYEVFLAKFLQDNSIEKGIVLTITLEDWAVKWVTNVS